MDTDVIIVGGGLAGLACGLELSGSGLSVILLESGSGLGGRARSWVDDETCDVIDIGPHILLTEYRNMRRLMEELGTAGQVAWQTDKFITFVDDPRPVDIKMRRLPAPFHFLPSLLAAPQMSLRDLASNRRVMWRAMRLNDRDALRLDEITAESYLRELGVTRHGIDWFWRSASMAIMNVPLERCSAGALLRFFRFMMGRSGYRVGLATGGLGELFAPGAAARIQARGGRVLTNTAVAAVCGGSAAADGVRLVDGTLLKARAVVSALPPRELLAALPKGWIDRHPVFQNLGRFKASPYISTVLWFDRKLTRQRFWSRVWAPGNLSYDSYDLSNIRTGWAGRPSVVASNIIYSHRADGLSDDDIVAAVRTELGEFLPAVGEAKLLHARVNRIPMAIPAPYPGLEQLRPPTSTPVDRFSLAGDWVATGLPASMESAVRSGYLAAEQVLSKLGRPRRIAMPLPAAEGLARLIGGP
jgi:squalene-associated FAD-dependent desaturase